MSYQPQPPQGFPPEGSVTQGSPVQGFPPGMPMSTGVYQPAYGAIPTPPPPGKRRKGLMVVGELVMLAAIGGGVALYVTSSNTYESAVRAMARAPLGCTTSLDFAKAGTFNVFVETTGSTADIRGDCAANDASYDRSATDLPQVELVLTDADDKQFDLVRADGIAYDAGGFVGSSVRTVRIDEPGSYRLQVSSDDDNFAISIGKDPQKDADNQRNLGIGLAALGLIVGGGLTLLGLRRKQPPSVPQVGPTWGQQGPTQQGPTQQGPTWGQQGPMQPAPSWPAHEHTVPQPTQPTWAPVQPQQVPPQAAWPQQPQVPPPPPPPGWNTPQ